MAVLTANLEDVKLLQKLNMLTKVSLTKYLKAKHDMAVGELTLERFRRSIAKIAEARIKISGRSYKTGRKKTVSVSAKDLGLSQ